MNFYTPDHRSHVWERKSTQEKFNAMGSWFLGPKGENQGLMKDALDVIVDASCKARRDYFPSDPNFITDEMQDSADYRDSVKVIHEVLADLNQGLAEHSTPFYSPRYAAHMSFDVALPAVLGNLAALQYNQNNLTPESSPFTSIIEHKVGLELCAMLGFNVEKPTSTSSMPDAWGHITSGGTVANIESMWVARNLKYYPLSLKMAMAPGNPLAFTTASFVVSLCTGETKNFYSCSTWELFNLEPTEVLDLPVRLTSQFGISQTTLDRILDPYNIQTIGKHQLDIEFGVDPSNTPQYILSKANHYSWLKSAALTGIGKANVIELPLTEDARMDSQCLEDELEKHLAERRAVYAVVAIIGTTEHGAVDPLSTIVEVRKKMQKKGLSFMIHCDAAWGGYFASMKADRTRALFPPPSFPLPLTFSPDSSVPPSPPSPFSELSPLSPLTPLMTPSSPSSSSATISSGPSTPATSPPPTPLPHSSYAFPIRLSDYTNDQMLALRFADSITIDPHKSGYNPHSAGAICYRDKRFRYLTTWTSPYLSANTGDESSVGIYGVEGSKSGATPAGVWMALKVLKQSGYADLLGVTMLTGKKMYANWATMTLDSTSLTVTPFLQLPSERAGLTAEEVNAERVRIRDRILLQPNALLEQDDETLEFMEQLGSDLMINPFACNFHHAGKLNTDVVEASFLNRRLFKRFSVSRIREGEAGLDEKPLILMPMKYLRSKYGDVLKKFKDRMGLVDLVEGDEDEELYALSNVSMSPWPTANGFLKTMADAFKMVAEEEIQTTLVRVEDKPSIHSFVIHGSESLFLVYVGSFNVERYRRQVILKIRLTDHKALRALQEVRARKPGSFFSFHAGPLTLGELLRTSNWRGDIYEGLPAIYGRSAILTDVSLEVNIVLDKSLHRSNLHKKYPTNFPFYLFGDSEETHIDHPLFCAPNALLTASGITLNIDPPLSGDMTGKFLVLDEMREDMMQPFNAVNLLTLFSPNRTFKVSIHNDPIESTSSPISTGTMTLPRELGKLFVDSDVVNVAAASDIYISSISSSASIDDAAFRIASLFDENKILWEDNVVNAIRRLCPEAKGLNVSMGTAPHKGDFRILSRFMGWTSSFDKSSLI